MLDTVLFILAVYLIIGVSAAVTVWAEGIVTCRDALFILFLWPLLWFD